MGRGMGRRGGRGMGQGAGLGMRRGRKWVDSTGDAVPEPQPQEISPANPDQEIDGLKAQAQVMEEQLAAIRRRIDQMGQGATDQRLVAMVTREQCVGCGICVQVCPAQAITIDEVAQVDIDKCVGCGQCVAECPRGAISLQQIS